MKFKQTLAATAVVAAGLSASSASSATIQDCQNITTVDHFEMGYTSTYDSGSKSVDVQFRMRDVDGQTGYAQAIFNDFANGISDTRCFNIEASTFFSGVNLTDMSTGFYSVIGETFASTPGGLTKAFNDFKANGIVADFMQFATDNKLTDFFVGNTTSKFVDGMDDVGQVPNPASGLLLGSLIAAGAYCASRRKPAALVA